MLQPASKGNEHKQHWRCVEKSDWTLYGRLTHGYNQNHAGVNVGNSGGQNDENVHVSHSVSQRAIGLDIEVSTSEDLTKEETKDQELFGWIGCYNTFSLNTLVV